METNKNKTEALLDVRGLNVEFKVLDGTVKAVNGLSFKIYPGEIVGVVGESGSGKSQTMLAIMGLLANNSAVSGSVKFQGKEIIGLSSRELNKIRGNKISMIFQDPMTSLNPYLTIKSQMIEVLTTHQKISEKEAFDKALELLELVKITDASSRINQYPHELSGGMRQRVMIAMALLCNPSLLIADEPTTALDVTVQAQILQIVKDIREKFNTSIIFITHDMGVIANLCDRVNVMYGGWLMETGSIESILEDAKHPYTKALIETIPSAASVDKDLRTIPGEPPNLLNLPQGCPFAPRCDKAIAKCAELDIPLVKIANRRVIKCSNSGVTL